MATKDYGTAPHEEVMKGFDVAMKIAKMIRDIPSPAVRNMIKKLVALADPA